MSKNNPLEGREVGETTLYSSKPKEQPILMSTPMVQALLNGTKTETRRDKNLKEINEDADEWGFVHCIIDGDGKNPRALVENFKTGEIRPIKCPWSVGNILWCRETWKPAIEGKVTMYNAIRYKADSASIPLPDEDIDWFNNLTKDGKFNYQSSMFMRRKFARIFLRITEIKLERLHDITEEGAIAEGICEFTKDETVFKYGLDGQEWATMPYTAVKAYKALWESINGEGSWNSNPFVWVVKFEKLNSYNGK